MIVKTKGCKKCKMGDISINIEEEGSELFCVQCGYRPPYELGMLMDLRARIHKQIKQSRR